MTAKIEALSLLEPPAELVDRYPDFFADHCEDGEFFNPWTGKTKPPFTDLLKWQFSKNPHKEQKRLEEPVAPTHAGLEEFEASDAAVKMLWLGHASFLVEVDGLRCLIDPVYGKVGAFVKRFSEDPYPLDDLPDVHAILVTHGHYDHLDTQTLRRCAEIWPDAHFLSPLGQGRYFPDACGEVRELDWWDRLEVRGVSVTLVPTQHWHRRGLTDHNKALWGGWVLGDRVLHAGDSGYCEVFSLLGELFDLDIAILPVGAYEPRWFMKPQHMNPEEALQSFHELDADHMVGMHWGTYDLTDEPLNEGARRARELAEDSGLADRVHVPAPGEFVTL
ncbi:MAG: MBL fold metallo-hydrolase [Myxococcota bacterium]